MRLHFMTTVACVCAICAALCGLVVASLLSGGYGCQP